MKKITNRLTEGIGGEGGCNLKKLMCWLATVLVCFSIFKIISYEVAADEGGANVEIDFDTVDWETLDWTDDEVEALKGWISKQETSKLFSVYYNIPEFCYYYKEVLVERLLTNPAAFMRALALEDREFREMVAVSLVRAVYNELILGADDLPDVIFSTELTEDDSEETHRVLQSFKDAVSHYWGINPKTGDSAGAAAALLAASGAGLAALPVIRKKKKDE